MEHPLAKFSDYLLHMPQLIVTWSMFFAAGVAIYLIYLIKNGIPLSILECFGIQEFRNMSFRKSLYMDITMYLIGKATDFIVAAPYAAANIAACQLIVNIANYVAPNHETIFFGYFWASVWTIIMFVAGEFSEFVFHFAEHKIPVLWEFHKVHHSAHQLNPLTSKRNHPVSLLLGGIGRGFMTGLVAGVVVSVYGLSMIEALALSLIASKIFIIATLDPLKHSHYNISLGALDRILISPHMHQIHHSKLKAHWDKNFGNNISIFDWAFNTAYKPRKGEKPLYGISGYSNDKLQSYNTLYGAYVSPMIKAMKISRRKFRNTITDTSAAVKSAVSAGEPALVLDQQQTSPQANRTMTV